MSDMIKPYRDLILTVAVEKSDEEKSILVNADDDGKESSIALVLEVGPDVKNIKRGQKIVFDKTSASTATLKGTEYIFIKEEKVIAILEGDKK